jgi:hypothetical protein
MFHSWSLVAVLVVLISSTARADEPKFPFVDLRPRANFKLNDNLGAGEVMYFASRMVDVSCRFASCSFLLAHSVLRELCLIACEDPLASWEVYPMAGATRNRRSSFVKIRDSISLGKGRAVLVWGYDTNEKFVCRMEISSAGVALYSGTKGGKRLCNADWETLVKKLSNSKS